MAEKTGGRRALREERVAALNKRYVERHRHYRTQLAKLLANWEADVESIDQERQWLRDHADDREVLIRLSEGDPVRIFHSAEHPCGRVSDPDRFRRDFESTARAGGLRPCSACAS